MIRHIYRKDIIVCPCDESDDEGNLIEEVIEINKFEIKPTMTLMYGQNCKDGYWRYYEFTLKKQIHF